ncbi:MAG: hypothetical protein PG981_001346 [Wolbachia endosymbiont of Ctenocephalides orientis wCori]|nr:MAG: hypothetical protein PG981_001346 [Wolbachia endosymbiont of Ctenocephalides orientis wCori]
MEKRLSTTLYANAGSIIYDIGYDYTDDIKISIGPSIPAMAFYEGIKASEEAQKWIEGQQQSGKQIIPENWMQQAQN